MKILCSHIFGVILFHSYLVAAYSLTTSGTIHKPNSALSKLCFDSIRSIILTGNKINGFQWLRTIWIPTDMLLSSFTLSKILSRCPYCFNFDCIAATSLFLITSYYMYLESQGNRQNYFCCLLLSVH